MPTYPTPSEMEIEWRKSGAGVCVIVEGETELDDPWFYNQWFGNRAREIAFFPQNGWEKVIDAVTELRDKLGDKRVYGIIDRDFETKVSYPPIPRNGVFRTEKYTLENYLLDPNCWFKYVSLHTRRRPKPVWNTLSEAQQTIESLYRECIPLAAYNKTLREARNLDYDAFKALPETNKTYREHPEALKSLGDVGSHLRQIQNQIGLGNVDLKLFYEAQLARLKQVHFTVLEEEISGKYILKLLKERSPLEFSSKKAWDDVLSAYIYFCPDPPKELESLINLILHK